MNQAPESLCVWLNDTLGWRDTRFVSALSGGNSNLTWRFSAGEASCVVRTPPVDDISPTSARGIQREAQVLTAIGGQAKVPRVFAWCEDESIIGRPFLVQEWFDGVALTEALPQAYADQADAVDRLGEDLVDQLVAVHTISCEDPALAALGRPEGFLERQIQRWLSVRSEHSVRDLPQLFSLGEWLAGNLPEPTAPALIHGDYHLDNTLASRSRPEILAIIDWELATIGDPYMDVALMLMFWGDYRTAEPPAFARLQALSRRPGALSRRALAERWAQGVGRRLVHLDFYMALAFWRLAAIIEGAYGLYVAGKLQSDYAKGLEYDVPALLAEAQRAAEGDW